MPWLRSAMAMPPGAGSDQNRVLGLIGTKRQEGGGAGVYPAGSLMYAVTFRMIVASMLTLVVEPGICVGGRTAESPPGRVNATRQLNR